MRKLLSGVALTALLLSGCAAPRNETAASNGTSAPTAATNDADPALWLVKDGDTNIYLFGTFHLLRPGLSWFDEEVRAAYDRSDEVVFEIVEPEPAAAQAGVLRYAISRDGPPLREKLSPAARVKYEAVMRELGQPAEAFDRFKPWFAALTMSLLMYQKAGFDPNSGAEKVIAAQAKSAGKRVGELETFEQQLGFFDGLTEAQQIAFLEEGLEQADDAEAMTARMLQYWSNGDPDQLGALINESMRTTPELAKVLLADRNARWAQWIDDRMDRPGNVFVAVGAGHLAGADSVQTMLAQRNLRATRVRY